ncbi:MAG: NYN domain-containing protein [Synergistaceae bacterium]|nr:NYN domain-containing protein [Synergistaceae bacterium]
MDKVAIFVDWQNLYGCLSVTLKKDRSLVFDCNNMQHLIYLFHSFLLPRERLFRIFLYTALPMTSGEVESFCGSSRRYSGTAELGLFQKYWFTPEMPGNTNSSPKARHEYTYEMAREFQENLMKSDFFALRLGQQRCQNLEANGRPNLVQKQVDMLIGLDISHVSFYRQVDTILVFSKDTDMVPVLNVARTAGLHTIVATIRESGFPDIKLQQYSDFRRILPLGGIDQEGQRDSWDHEKIKRVAADFK